jgi:RNA polymerase sigma-70 factor, ECF subfamily
VRRYAAALLNGDSQGAEDVVQETALRVWRHADSLDPGAESFRPWLFKVARRLVIDHHRRRSARPPENAGGVPEWLGHADQSDRSLSSIVVSDALASLSRPHREVLVELYFRGSRVDEAAAALGIPPGTVKSRSYHAMRALQLALHGRGVTGRE